MYTYKKHVLTDISQYVQCKSFKSLKIDIAVLFTSHITQGIESKSW